MRFKVFALLTVFVFAATAASAQETIRFWTMSVADYLDQYFETDVIKAAKSGSGIIGTALGVHSPGTAYVLLHHYMGEVDGNVGSWGFARGGMGSVSKAIAGAFQAAGGELPPQVGSGFCMAVES